MKFSIAEISRLLVRECCFFLTFPSTTVGPWDRDFLYALKDTFMADNPQLNDKPLYIFLQDLLLYPTENQVCLPDMFWAWDLEGNQRLTKEEMDLYLAQFDLTVQDLTLGVLLSNFTRWEQHQYDTIREVHERLGFNPDSREVADFLGYPPVEIDTEACATINFCTSFYQDPKEINVTEFSHSQLDWSKSRTTHRRSRTPMSRPAFLNLRLR